MNLTKKIKIIEQKPLTGWISVVCGCPPYPHFRVGVKTLKTLGITPPTQGKILNLSIGAFDVFSWQCLSNKSYKKIMKAEEKT